jgi:hypothetical protein
LGAQKGNEAPAMPEKNRGLTEKTPCKSMEQEEDDENSPPWRRANDQVGNRG